MNAPQEEGHTAPDIQSPDQSESSDDSEEDGSSSSINSEDFRDISCNETSQAGTSRTEEQKEKVDTEEILMDKRFQHILFSRKERFNAMQRVTSLQDLCVAATVENVDRYCLMKNPFNHLPGAILSLLMNALKEDDISVPKLIHCLITNQTKDLRISFFNKTRLFKPVEFWTSSSIYLVFHLINYHCEHKLQTLNLNFHMPNPEELVPPPQDFGYHCIDCMRNNHHVIPFHPNFDQLHSMLLHQKNLTNIDLSNCNIKDETIAIIGSTCKNLRYLNLTGNKNITDESIFYLCGSSKIYGCCKKLSSLDVSCTSISTLGIFMALVNLPDLEVLNCDTDKNIRFALMQIVDMYGDSKQLNLKNAVLNHKNSLILNQKIIGICKSLPNVNNLTIKFDDLTPFYNFTEINTLKLTTTASSLEVSELLIHYGTHLTNLDLVECSCVIDISLIGYFCPNMVDLRLDCTISSECTFNELLPHSFSNLENVVIYQDENLITTLPTAVLIKLLSSTYLKIYQCYQIEVPEKTMLMLLAEARDEALVFSSLTMFGCSVNSDAYSIDTWIHLICCAPNLYSIDVEDVLNGEKLAKVKKFIRRNKLGISLTRGLDLL